MAKPRFKRDNRVRITNGSGDLKPMYENRVGTVVKVGGGGRNEPTFYHVLLDAKEDLKEVLLERVRDEDAVLLNS